MAKTTNDNMNVITAMTLAMYDTLPKSILQRYLYSEPPVINDSLNVTLAEGNIDVSVAQVVNQGADAKLILDPTYSTNTIKLPIHYERTTVSIHERRKMAEFFGFDFDGGALYDEDIKNRINVFAKRMDLSDKMKIHRLCSGNTWEYADKETGLVSIDFKYKLNEDIVPLQARWNTNKINALYDLVTTDYPRLKKGYPRIGVMGINVWNALRNDPAFLGDRNSINPLFNFDVEMRKQNIILGGAGSIYQFTFQEIPFYLQNLKINNPSPDIIGTQAVQDFDPNAISLLDADQLQPVMVCAPLEYGIEGTTEVEVVKEELCIRFGTLDSGRKRYEMFAEHIKAPLIHSKKGILIGNITA